MVDIQLRFPRQEGQSAVTAPTPEWGDLQPYQAPAQAAPTAPAPEDWGQLQPYSPEQQQQVEGQEMPTAEKVWRGVVSIPTFGLASAIDALGAAAGPEWHQTQAAHDFSPVVGAAKMLHSYLAGHPDDQVRKDYEAGRRKAEEQEQEAGKSWAYTAGQGIGALLTPGLGAVGMAKGAPLFERLARGGLAGLAQGGLAGIGGGISAGETPGELLESGVYGGATGFGLGGAMGGALGPRLARVPTTPGQRAAAFAESLGTPIARGLASDLGPVRAGTAAIRSVPILGSRIAGGAQRAQEAAGEYVGDIAHGMAGGPTERALSDIAARSGLQQVIADNHVAQNGAYNAFRNEINTGQRYTMPATDAMLDQVMRERAGAGWTNPAQGLEQFRNVAGGATFNDAHRARVDAREAGRIGAQHPGYNANDFRRITNAMTQDLRGIAAASAKTNPQHALQLFDQAETQFGRLADQNDFLDSLANRQGEQVINQLLNAAREKNGDAQLLGQLKQKMKPDQFEALGGQLLSELGHHEPTDSFSLNQFVTRWNRVSPAAKRVLFSPQQQKDIDEVFNLGKQLKGSLREASTSHSASPLIIMDAIKDAVLTGAGMATGAVAGAPILAGAAAAAPAVLFMHYLSSPARVASMSKWSRAYQGMLMNPTPARTAVFRVATRNLANNIGVNAEDILRRTRAQQDQQPQSTGEGPNGTQ